MSGTLFIISAPSGAGKTSLLKQAMPLVPSDISFNTVITYTSRSPRKGEIDGKDYHFLSEGAFKKKIEEGFFLEWSNAYGNYYGSPVSIIDQLERGHSYCMILDRAGAQRVKEQIPQAVLIWITVSSIQVLAQRLKERGDESQQSIARRLDLAQKEIDEEKVRPLYTVYIYNDVFNFAVQQLLATFLDYFYSKKSVTKKRPNRSQNQV